DTHRVSEFAHTAGETRVPRGREAVANRLPGDERPSAVDCFDDPTLCELMQGAAHGEPVDAELPRQLRLAWQPVARPGPLDQPRLQHLAELAVQRTVGEPVDGRGPHRSGRPGHVASTAGRTRRRIAAEIRSKTMTTARMHRMMVSASS